MAPSCCRGWAPAASRDDDLRLVQVLADQAAVALENARSLASRDRLVQELEALLEISRAGSTEHDEAGLAGLVADILVRTSGADACVVSRWDEASADARDALLEGPPGLRSGGACGATWRGIPLTRRVAAGRPAAAGAQWTGPAPTPAETALLRRVGATQVLLLPLTATGRTIGLLELYLVDGRADLQRPGDRGLRVDGRPGSRGAPERPAAPTSARCRGRGPGHGRQQPPLPAGAADPGGGPERPVTLAR